MLQRGRVVSLSFGRNAMHFEESHWFTARPFGFACFAIFITDYGKHAPAFWNSSACFSDSFQWLSISHKVRGMTEERRTEFFLSTVDHLKVLKFQSAFSSNTLCEEECSSLLTHHLINGITIVSSWAWWYIHHTFRWLSSSVQSLFKESPLHFGRSLNLGLCEFFVSTCPSHACPLSWKCHEAYGLCPRPICFKLAFLVSARESVVAKISLRAAVCVFQPSRASPGIPCSHCEQPENCTQAEDAGLGFGCSATSNQEVVSGWLLLTVFFPTSFSYLKSYEWRGAIACF